MRVQGLPSQDVRVDVRVVVYIISVVFISIWNLVK